VLGIYTGSGDIQLKNGQSDGNLQIDASLATIANGGSGGLVNIGNQINTLTIVGGRIQNQIKDIGSKTRNVFFDRRFAQNGFAPPWYPSTTVTSSGSSSSAMSTTIQRTKWLNRTTYELSFPAQHTERSESFACRSWFCVARSKSQLPTQRHFTIQLKFRFGYAVIRKR